MRKAKVFNSHGCTTAIHNALIDQVMPGISGNAWKLLCLIVRQTDGWNRAEVGLSYRDLIAGMGVSSRGTVAAAVEELKPFGLLKIAPGGKWEETRYSLDLGAIVDWQPVNFNGSPVTKIGTGDSEASGTEIGTGDEALPVTKIGTDSPVTKIVPVPEIVTAPVTEIGTAPVPKIGTPPVTKIVPSYRKESNIEFIGKQSLADATAPASDSTPNSSENLSGGKPRKAPRSAKPKPAGIPCAEYEKFAGAFLTHYGTPYGSKQADFVQLARLKRTCEQTSWALTDERLRKAIENYFGSDLSGHTLADMCARFSTFYRGRVDRYGKFVNGANGATNGATNGAVTDPNIIAGLEAKRRLFGAQAEPIDAEVIYDPV